MADDRKTNMTASEIMLEKLSVENGEEYTDFLIEAYKDQFHAGMFKDRQEVKERWLWEYVKNPASVQGKPLIWILRIRGKMAGQMCVMPVTLNICGKPYKSGWCQDFIVLPEHRKKGMGYSIVKQVTELSNKYVDMLLAIVASEASYKVFQKASYIDVGFMNRGVIISNPRNLSGSLIGNRMIQAPLSFALGAVFWILGIVRPFCRDNNLKISQYSGELGELDDFYSKISGNLPFKVNRDSGFMAWRFLDQPRSSYKIIISRSKAGVNGYLALREADISRGRFDGLKAGIISDILYDPEEKGTALALLSEAIRYLKGRVDIIRFDYLSPGLGYISGLSGFLNSISRNRFYAAPLSEELKAKDADFFKYGWHLTCGDSDLDLF